MGARLGVGDAGAYNINVLAFVRPTRSAHTLPGGFLGGKKRGNWGAASGPRRGSVHRWGSLSWLGRVSALNLPERARMRGRAPRGRDYPFA